MTVHLYDRQEKELLHIKAEIYLPGVKGLIPHRVVQDVNKDDTLLLMQIDMSCLISAFNHQPKPRTKRRGFNG